MEMQSLTKADVITTKGADWTSQLKESDQDGSL